MGMGQGVRTGLGHGGITCVLQTQFPVVVFFVFCFFFFFVFFGGGGGGVEGEQRNMAIYLKGTLENK